MVNGCTAELLPYRRVNYVNIQCGTACLTVLINIRLKNKNGNILKE